MEVNEFSDPDAIALQRFLLAVLIARPAISLGLPGITRKEVKFDLGEKEKAIVQEATTKFCRTKGILSSRSGNQDSGLIQEMGLAVQAQVAAAHLLLAEFVSKTQPVVPLGDEIDGDPEDIVVRLVDMQATKFTGGLVQVPQRLVDL